MRTLTVALVATMLLASEARAAFRLHRTESATAGVTVTDGDRYAAWVHGAVVRVLDERSGKVSSHPLPADCRPPDALGDGHVAAVCGDAIRPKDIRLMDLQSGDWTSVPPKGFAARVAGALNLRIAEAGRAWLSVWVEDHADQWNPVWIERGSGRAVTEVPKDRTRYPNVDAQRLWSRLCTPLRRRQDPRAFEPGRFGSPYMPAISGRRGLGISHRSLVLRHCGAPRPTVLTRSVWWTGAFFAGARVSWIEYGPSHLFPGNRDGNGWLRTYDAATGRRGRWHIPGQWTNDPETVHTRKHIFLDKVFDDAASYAVERYMIDL